MVVSLTVFLLLITFGMYFKTHSRKIEIPDCKGIWEHLILNHFWNSRDLLFFFWALVCADYFTGPSQGGPGPQYPNYPQGQGQQYGGYRPAQPGPPQPPQQRPYGYDQVSYPGSWDCPVVCSLSIRLHVSQLKIHFSRLLFIVLTEKRWLLTLESSS